MENRIKEHKEETRSGSKACFRVKYDEGKSKYVVTRFVTAHNHDLALETSVQFMRLHRKVDEDDLAQAKLMKQSGIKVSQIMRYFALQASGYHKVGFMSKDLYKKMEEDMRKVLDLGDAEKALGYMAGVKDKDNMFFFKYMLDEEGRLSTLFWADGRLRLDYTRFGDVLVFGSIYWTNGYGRPLVVFDEVNNHYSNIVFGCVLMAQEDMETYEWMLETFVETMDGKKPEAVMTDGDRVMLKVIDKFIPGA